MKNSSFRGCEHRTLIAESLSVGVDIEHGEPVIGVLVKPETGKSFVMPIDLDSARRFTASLMRMIIAATEAK
jgi:hypothetical protein